MLGCCIGLNVFRRGEFEDFSVTSIGKNGFYRGVNFLALDGIVDGDKV